LRNKFDFIEDVFHDVPDDVKSLQRRVVRERLEGYRREPAL
jgi:hypothetical protein